MKNKFRNAKFKSILGLLLHSYYKNIFRNFFYFVLNIIKGKEDTFAVLIIIIS